MIDGGAAILAASNINHHIDRLGVKFSMPFVMNDLRVWVIEYEIFAKINRAEDDSPWAIIIIIAPLIPHFLMERTPAISNPIWPTEEYAIIDFMSGWRMQIRLVKRAPIDDKAIIK